MHGSILNGLEKLTEKQRQISARQRLEAERINELKAAAPEGSPSLGESEKVLRYVAEVGLGFALAWLLDGTGMVNDSKGAETIPFYHHVEMRELRQRVRDLVEELPEQERLVVFSHYLQQQPFDEICVSMSLSKGRISQIHRRALTRLRDSLRGHSPLDVHW
jgi:RNA polymerase sigma factor for flagellar operon FliA